jgi:predicted nucleic acid-binding protein
MDTSVFVGLERRGASFEALASIAPDLEEGVAFAAITASELLIGVHRAKSPDRRANRSAFVELLLDRVPVIAFDLRIARVHALLHGQLLDAGHPIGAHDLQIAATALATGQAVFTDNVREFCRVPGLQVRQPQWKSRASLPFMGGT